MRTSILATALLAACAQAVQITGITKDQKIDLAAGYTVTWSTVSSDPSTAHLFLVQMSGGKTPFSKDLGEVDLKKGSFAVKEPAAAADSGYQFNLQSVDPLNTGILAQSQQFQVVKAGDDEDDAKTTKTESSAAPTATVTSSGSVTKVTEGAEATTFATATATGSGAGAASGTKTGTAAPDATTAGAATNKVGVLAALALAAVAL